MVLPPINDDAPSNASRRPLPNLTPLGWVGAAVVLAVAARTLWLAVSYLLARPGAMRFQVESAATAFAFLAFVFRWLHSRKTVHPRVASGGRPGAAVIVWCGLALVLYGRMLFTGFLSDDYVLVQRASSWRIGAVSTELFRPVPLALWAVLLNAGAGAATLHLVNIIAHGVNAFLVTRLVERWMPGRLASLMAGALFVTFPLAPEAVVWCAGIFDVLATTLVLACVLVSRRYDVGPTYRRRIAFVALGLAALLSKETAAVAGVLVLVDAWLRRSRSRPLFVDAGVLIAVAAVFGIIRIAASDLVRQPLTRYAVQRFLFGEFGSLAVPWHIAVIRSTPWLPIVCVIIVVGLVLTFALRDGDRAVTRVALAALVWIVVAGAPLATMFFVAADLQGSRYLYLPAVGWAALLAAIGGEGIGEHDWRRAGVAVIPLGVLIVAAAAGVWFHQGAWQRAAALRNRVQSAARSDPRMASCAVVQLVELPDSVDGAYVFRNGAAEAFARDVRRTATVEPVADSCAFRWNAGVNGFVPAR